MATTLDCHLLRNIFGSDRMRHVFNSGNLLQHWLDIWAILALAQAEFDLIPQDAAEKIVLASTTGSFDVEKIGKEIATGRHILMPAINALVREAGDAGKYVHWGATTQDITDTALVLQVRDALDHLQPSIEKMIACLTSHIEQHGHHVMAGRTHWQHAVPITLGFKLAGWVDELVRHRDRLGQARAKVLVGQLGGASGTLASIGEVGLKVRASFCRRAGLADTEIAWFAARDRLGELVSTLGLIAATIEKICLEIGRLSANEIGELHEPRRDGQVGSSTMPQKHNPILCERAIASCKLVRGMVPVMQGLMIGAHERDSSCISAEWILIPQSFILLDGAVQYAETVFEGLQIHGDRMRQNLETTDGGIVAEAVMYALAPALGRNEAHHLLHQITRNAIELQRPLIDVLLERHEVTSIISKKELIELVSPQNHLGLAGAITNDVITRPRHSDSF